MQLLEGRSLSKERLASLKSQISDCGLPGRPGLAVILVGNDPASKIYVSKKMKTCEELGIMSQESLFKEDVTQEELLKKIDELNQDKNIHGILVQLPLPKHLNTREIIERVDPRKDVDGFHPYNLGKLAAGENTYVACTPYGIMKLFEHYKIPLKGKRAVVMGRSRVVGRPMSLLLDLGGATVTVVHLGTKEPERICQEADILVVATGSKHLVGAQHIKEGAVVIDVGIHRLDSGKLTGDVDFEAVKNKVSAITPVPGGVGPMTICGLMENTFQAFQVQSSAR
jgi:methylenetetrahydrofolate dehydrogenase (NADP+)/methenyltetrahydrofolate cyclohydrolase